jgi:hypothetical protein
MDNFHIDIHSEGKESFIKAFILGCREYKIIGYRIDENKGMVLYWSESVKEKIIKLPYEMKPEQAAIFVYDWLIDHAEYGHRPDIDGDSGKGWKIYTDSWGQVNSEWQTILAVKPIWAMYGK